MNLFKKTKKSPPGLQDIITAYEGAFQSGFQAGIEAAKNAIADLTPEQQKLLPAPAPVPAPEPAPPAKLPDCPVEALFVQPGFKADMRTVVQKSGMATDEARAALMSLVKRGVVKKKGHVFAPA